MLRSHQLHSRCTAGASLARRAVRLLLRPRFKPRALDQVPCSSLKFPQDILLEAGRYVNGLRQVFGSIHLPRHFSGPGLRVFAMPGRSISGSLEMGTFFFPTVKLFDTGLVWWCSCDEGNMRLQRQLILASGGGDHVPDGFNSMCSHLSALQVRFTSQNVVASCLLTFCRFGARGASAASISSSQPLLQILRTCHISWSCLVLCVTTTRPYL